MFARHQNISLWIDTIADEIRVNIIFLNGCKKIRYVDDILYISHNNNKYKKKL